MADLVHGEKEHSDWFPEWSIFCYVDHYRRSAHELISLTSVIAQIGLFKKKHSGVKLKKWKPFPCSLVKRTKPIFPRVDLMLQ